MTPPPSELVVRATALYVPITIIIALAAHRRPSRSQVAGAVVALAWNLVALLAVNAIAQRVGWWSYTPTSATLMGMPIDLWLGWSLLWGVAPLFVRTDRLAAVGCALVLADVVLMPLAEPVINLHSAWLVGEFVAALTSLGPGLLLGYLTARDIFVRARAALQFIAFSGLLLYVLPAIILTITDDDWNALLNRPRWHFVLAALIIAPAAGMALQALREFAVIGGGTPLPLDPPQRLVITGPYAYVSNPMQVGGTLILGAWGVLLGSQAVIAAAAMAAVFSLGIAAWSENSELTRRFGDDWLSYRRNVRPWIPRWRPHVTEPAEVFVGTTCEPCSEVGRFLARRTGTGLTILAAEDCDTALTRITYRTAAVGSERGLAALGRSLEHSNLGWAIVSWIVRLPLIEPLLQLVADAVGAGPRRLARSTTSNSTP